MPMNFPKSAVLEIRKDKWVRAIIFDRDQEHGARFVHDIFEISTTFGPRDIARTLDSALGAADVKIEDVTFNLCNAEGSYATLEPDFGRASTRGTKLLKAMQQAGL